MDYRGLFILLYFNCVYSLRWTTASPENSNADFEASESDLTYNGIPLVTPYQEPDVCKLDEDGQPPRPRIILLGATGVGKSTIGNRLFQGPYDSHLPEPPIVMENSYLEKAKDGLFGVGDDLVSHTNETVWKVGKWLGDSDNKCVTIIDTQGMQDTENRTCQFTRDIGNVVRTLGDIDTFLLLFKGETNRLTPAIRQQINIFQQLFGMEFWRKVIIEITFWTHDRRRRKERAKGRKKTEKEKTENWQKILRSEMGVPVDVPLVFIDGVIDEEYADEKEMEIFNTEAQKLLNFMEEGEPYHCSSATCKSTAFTHGVPTSMDMEMGPNRYVRKNDPLRLKWQIWFAEDCHSDLDTRSYSILKDGEEIYRMVDQKISGGKAMKLFSKKGKVASTFPNHTQVRDECGVTTSNHQCDYDKSTWKYVILDFYNLDDYSVSSKYSVKNVFGESEPIELVPIVDGAWSDWSDWSSCSKTCLSQKDAKPGRRSRNRACDSPAPKNSGRSCLGEAFEEAECSAITLCQGNWEDWSPWSVCSKTCGRGARTRSRSCNDLTCSGEKLNDKQHVSNTQIVELDDECNNFRCPRDIEIGEWSPWVCNSKCFNPREEYDDKHTQTRTRSCKDYKYRPDPKKKRKPHPDPLHRCENIETKQTMKQCINVNFTVCPTMKKIIIETCDGDYDGTNDNVKLYFHGNGRKSCSTGFVNAVKSLRAGGGHEVMFKSDNALGDCRSFRFDQTLLVEVEIWRAGWNIQYDGYNFCRIEAVFGGDDQKEMQTKWKTIHATGFCDGCENRKVEMKKIVN